MAPHTCAVFYTIRMWSVKKEQFLTQREFPDIHLIKHMTKSLMEPERDVTNDCKSWAYSSLPILVHPWVSKSDDSWWDTWANELNYCCGKENGHKQCGLVFICIPTKVYRYMKPLSQIKMRRWGRERRTVGGNGGATWEDIGVFLVYCVYLVRDANTYRKKIFKEQN